MVDFEVFNESGIEIPLTNADFEVILETVQTGEKVTFGFIEIVYVDEKTIIEVNKEHLGRGYVTDVITFTYEDSDDEELNALDGTDIDGTIYMCAQRIAEQAEEFGTDQAQEFKRIIIHGLLHLCGFDDSTEELKQAMTQKENHYLQ